jgi:BatD DUF11 like domain
MRKCHWRSILFVVTLFVGPTGWAQDNIQIILGPDEIGENQAWTIHVSISNEQLKSYDNFPDIEGFRKRGTSTQSQTSIVNGQISSTQGVIMTYTPTKQGVFNLPAFKMKINNQIVSSNGKKIKVGPPIQVQARDPFRSFFDRDPFEDAFGGRRETEFVDVKEDAFLALSTNKEEVYVGEGFATTLSFFVAESNRAPMQFHELGPQLSEIIKKIRPAACWEENFNIENIEGETVSINNRNFTQYKIYQAVYYPLNNSPVNFPSVGLEMIKFKVAKNPSFFGQNRQEDFKTFYSKPKTVKVKDLPPHPLRDVVAVGDYRIDEKITSTAGETGKSLAYDFSIYGEGNISSIEKPTIPKGKTFDFFEPNVKQSINRDNGRVTGTKAFSYFVIPQEPGNFDFKDYVQWVYFNPKTKNYDTLKSKVSVVITGESKKNEFISSSDGGSFYDRISLADNNLRPTGSNGWLKIGLNVLALLMVGGSGWLMFKK